MAKIHVRPNGDTGRCSAKTEESCDYYAEGAIHFSEPKDAYAYSERLIREQEGGSFAGSTVASRKSADEEAMETSKYTKKWLQNEVIYDVIDRGEYFAYNGRVYQMYEANRFYDNGIVTTEIEAKSMKTGKTDVLFIEKFEQGKVSFMPPKKSSAAVEPYAGEWDNDPVETNPARYQSEWHPSEYLHSRIEPGEHFAYGGEVFELEKSDYNGATLSTRIQGINVETGETEVMNIYQDDQPRVTFLKEREY